MRRHHGQESRVYIGIDGAVAVLACELSEFNLERTTDRQEVTAFCDKNKTYVPGKPDVSGDFSGFWNSDSDMIFDAAETGQADIIFYPSYLVPEQYWYGPAWLDASIHSNVNNPVTIDGEFAAAGDWTRVGLAPLP